MKRQYIPVISIIFFVMFYCGIIYIKPSVIFYDDGTLRDFGVGYKNKTIFPLWLMSIFLGIWSYLLVLYFEYMV
jgi:hypothetical protein